MGGGSLKVMSVLKDQIPCAVMRLLCCLLFLSRHWCCPVVCFLLVSEHIFHISFPSVIQPSLSCLFSSINIAVMIAIATFIVTPETFANSTVAVLPNNVSYPGNKLQS